MKKLLLVPFLVLSSVNLLFAAVDDIVGVTADAKHLSFVATPADPALCFRPSNKIPYNLNEGVLKVTSDYYILFHNYLPLSVGVTTKVTNSDSQTLTGKNIGCYSVKIGNTIGYQWLFHFKRITNFTEQLSINTIHNLDIRKSKIPYSQNYSIYQSTNHWEAKIIN